MLWKFVAMPYTVSEIYALLDNAKLTYVRMMDVSTYLNKLLANDALNDDLCNFQAVERILSHPACKIVQQLQFDLDLIEVSNGFCFSISKREFVLNAIPASKIGKVSPRAFVKYDCSTPPQPQASTSNTIPGIDRWIHDNVMDCIVWVAKEIDQHRDLIPTDELWHERCNKSVINLVDGKTLWKRHEVEQITKADLQPHQIRDVQQPTIHPGFTAEVTSRHLARKRQKAISLTAETTRKNNL